MGESNVSRDFRVELREITKDNLRAHLSRLASSDILFLCPPAVISLIAFASNVGAPTKAGSD
jgi:hypothetical protein